MRPTRSQWLTSSWWPTPPRNAALKTFAWPRKISGCGKRKNRCRARSRPFGYLKLKLKEVVDAHDETVKAAKACELEHEQLMSGLVSEAERVNEIILGKNVSSLFFF